MTTNRIAPLFLVLNLLVVGCSGQDGTSKARPASDRIAVANDLLDSWGGRRERLEEARQILEAELVRDPRNYRALKEMSRYQMKSRYISDRNYSNGKYLYTLGDYEPGAIELAQETLKKALAINPNYVEAFIALGFVYTEAGNFDTAKIVLQRAKSLGTADPLADINLASVYYAEGNLSEAQKYCTLAEASTSGNSHILNDIYLCSLKVYKAQDNREKVVEYYRKMVDLHGDNAWIRGNFAAYLRSTIGDYEEAVRYAREAVAIMAYGVGYRELAQSLYAKWADMLIRQGVPDAQAEPVFAEAFALNPNLVDVMAYGGAEPTGGDLVKALMRKGISIDGRSADGSTALLIAVNTGQTGAVKALLELGADPDVAADNGWTPLLSAADEGNEEAVRLLLEHGADRNATMLMHDAATNAPRGHHAEDIARRRGHVKIAELISSFDDGEEKHL